MQSDAIRGNQMQSEAIRGHQMQSGELVAAHLLHHAVHRLVEARGSSIPHNGLRRERAALFTRVASGDYRDEPATVDGHVHNG